jgi:putative hydrolase of the HAD superfamily
MKPRIVLWDVMGTLVTEPFLEAMPRHLGMSFEEMLQAKDKDSWIEFEHGRIDEDEYVRRFFADRRPVDKDALKAAMRAHYALLPGVEPLLQALAANGVRQVALSNYSAWWNLIEEATGLSRYIGWDFVSCRTGYRKPDPEAYLAAARGMDVAPEQCVFVDDRRKNVEGARQVGMTALLRTPDVKALQEQLSQLGLLDP